LSAASLAAGEEVKIAYAIQSNGWPVTYVEFWLRDPLGTTVKISDFSASGVATLPGGVSRVGTYSLQIAFVGNLSGFAATYYRAGSIEKSPSGLTGPTTHSLNFSGIDFTILAAAAPVIVAQPEAQSINEGRPFALSVLAASASPLTYQWKKDGVSISGATASTLSVSSGKPADSGTYSVVVSNVTGSVTSSSVLVVIYAAPSIPSITSQPAPTAVSVGQPFVLSVGASGVPAPSYQWRKDGVAISGATLATLTVGASRLEDSGIYSVVVSNSTGSVTSSGARVTVNLAVINPARLINLSIMTPLEEGETMTLGTVLGGRGTSGTKPLLFRAAGPSLTQFGVASVMSDPRMDLYAGQSLLAVNNDWNGTPALVSAFSAVGAFPYSGNASLDAAIFNPELSPANYSVQVRGVGLSAGTVLAEIYDSTSTGTFTAATPRLVNVSVLKHIRAGDSLTAGFVIGGSGGGRVLIRAIGPTLAQPPFGITGVMDDPKLTIYASQTIIAANDNWGGAPTIGAVADSVGAFKITDAGSKDAVVLLSLAPGNYTAVVSSTNGGGGITITEVYEVP